MNYEQREMWKNQVSWFAVKSSRDLHYPVKIQRSSLVLYRIEAAWGVGRDEIAGCSNLVLQTKIHPAIPPCPLDVDPLYYSTHLIKKLVR